MSNRETLINSRKKRIALLKEMVTKNPDKPINEIVAKFCVESGVREAIAQQYYKLLIEAKEINPVEQTPQKP